MSISAFLASIAHLTHPLMVIFEGLPCTPSYSGVLCTGMPCRSAGRPTHIFHRLMTPMRFVLSSMQLSAS